MGAELAHRGVRALKSFAPSIAIQRPHAEAQGRLAEIARRGTGTGRRLRAYAVASERGVDARTEKVARLAENSARASIAVPA